MRFLSWFLFYFFVFMLVVTISFQDSCASKGKGYYKDVDISVELNREVGQSQKLLSKKSQRQILSTFLGPLPETETSNLIEVLPSDYSQVYSTFKTITIIGSVLIIITAGILILFRLLDKSKKDPLAYQFTSRAGRSVMVVSNAVLILLIILLAWWALNSIKTKVKADMQESLQTVLQISRESLNIWVNDHKSKLNNIAKDPRIIEYTTGLLQRYDHQEDLLSSPELSQLREIFKDLKRLYNHIGFFIIAQDGMSVGSLRNSNVGTPNLIYQGQPELINQVFSGETVLVTPIPSDVPLRGNLNITGLNRPPTMFFAAPIRNNDGKVIAALTERFNPHDDFSRIIELGRIGKSGETYSFNRQGRLLTKSRFLDQLKSIKLIKPEDQSILSIVLKDPGGNLIKGFRSDVARSKLPFTQMAASAIGGHTGTNIEGYRDYRGVQIVGVWVWDNALDMGIASKLDLDEAMASYYSARLVILFILGITAMVLIVFTLLTMVFGSRANRALQNSRDRLEERVEERTFELSKSKEWAEHALEQLKISELELKDNERRLLRAQRIARMGEWNYDILIDKRTWSDPFYELLDINKSVEPSIDAIMERIHPDDFERVRAKQNEAYGAGDGYNQQYRIILTDGEIRHVESKTEFEFNHAGQVIRAFGTLQDISEQVMVENKLKDAVCAADEANKAKSAFLANMSHEIRTPMNAILGYSQIMQHDTTLSVPQHKNLSIMDQSGKHLLKLINDILEMSKIEAGRTEIKPITFDLNCTLEDIIQMFAVKTVKKGIDLKLEKKMIENIGPIFQDESKIRQVLINLLGNAVKFTQEGFIILRVSYRLQEEVDTDNPEQESSPFIIVFEVEDSGFGICKKEQGKIFNAFDQAEEGRNTEGGTGLGLAISHQYAGLMEGDLILSRSEVGKGSLFTFTVSAKPGKEDLCVFTQESLPVERLKPGQPEITILIVDDRYLNRDVFSLMLNRVGFIIHTAKNGKEAIEMIPSLKPDCVLMDIRMPVMDGVEATKRIRQMAGGKEIVVIAVSASALNEQRVNVLKNGADAFIKKPVREEELFEELRHQLGVEYIYEKVESIFQKKISPLILKRVDISTLSKDMQTSVYKAALIGDISRLNKITDEIATINLTIAISIARYLDNFDLKTILNLFTPEEGQNAIHSNS